MKKVRRGWRTPQTVLSRRGFRLIDRSLVRLPSVFLSSYQSYRDVQGRVKLNLVSVEAQALSKRCNRCGNLRCIMRIDKDERNDCTNIHEGA